MSVTKPAEHGEPQAAFCASLVDEWVRAGVTKAVVCPGSRSTPMALALWHHPEIAVLVRLDERSAAFTALGIGLASGSPAVLLTTSGTAAAEAHAAVVEADLARVAMILCTADRPPELHGVGAPQTVDQQNLFGNAVRWFCDPGVADWATSAAWRSWGARAFAESTTGPRGPGPVHLNLPFREPLVADPGQIPPGRSDGRPWHAAVRFPTAEAFGSDLTDSTVCDTPAAGSGSGTRDGLKPTAGVIVAGRNCGDPKAVMELASLLRWPVLADPCSGCRSEGSSGQVPVVAAADSILRSSLVAERLRPEVVVKLGSPWASKVVNQWLDESAEMGASVLVVDPHWAWSDPQRGADVVVAQDASFWCSRVVQELRSGRQTIDGQWPMSLVAPAEPGWAELWAQVELAAQTAIEDGCSAGHEGEHDALAKADAEAEASADAKAEADAVHDAWASGRVSPAVVRIVTGGFGRPACVVASSSMAIREIEWFGTCGPDTPIVRSNRGANGIDGVVSTAVGVAIAAGPTVAVVGDLAFLHDLTALIGWREVGPPLTVVVLDNGGGAIFSFLPQGERLKLSEFESLFTTPQGHDLGAITSSLGLRSSRVESPKELIDALEQGVESGGLSVIHVKVAGSKSLVRTHEMLNVAVANAVEEVANRESAWTESVGGDTSVL